MASNATITSDTVTMTGFDGPLSAVCTGCEVSRNGGAFAATVSGFAPGDTSQLRVLSGGSGQTVSASVTLGDTTSDTWQVTSATISFELFTGSTQFTVPSGVSSMRVLVVGGGGGGGGGGILIDGAGPDAGDGPRIWSAMGGAGYGSGGGAGGYDSGTSSMRERGGDGADGVVYVEW